MKAAAIVLSILLCVPGAALAAVSARLGSEMVHDPLLRTGLTALYDLDYPRTARAAKTLIERRPENPYTHLFEAAATWWEAATEGLSAKDAPRLAERFETSSERAIQRGEALFKAPEKKLRAEGYFVAGMALGLRGQWHLANGKFMKAYFSGKKAVKYLKRCVKLDPKLYDAYLGLGIFDYQVAVLPGIMKIGALLIMRGDAQRGMRRIHLGIEKGRFAAEQGSQFLLTLLILFERDYDKALDLSEKLVGKFPTSPYFQFVRVMMLDAVGRWEDSYTAARDLFSTMSETPQSLPRRQWGAVCGLFGKDCLDDKDRLRSTESWLTRAIEHREPQVLPGWKARLHLYRGLVRDMLRRRDEAIADYERVLALPESADTHPLAVQCREKACRTRQVRKLRPGIE